MDRSFVIGIILGATAGAIAGLIYAPRPGFETRGDIAGRSRRAAHRLGELTHIIAEHGPEEKIKQAI